MKKIEKKLPKNIDLPKKFLFTETSHTKEIKKIVEKEFFNHPGSVDSFWIGTTRKDSWECFDNFIKTRLIFWRF